MEHPIQVPVNDSRPRNSHHNMISIDVIATRTIRKYHSCRIVWTKKNWENNDNNKKFVKLENSLFIDIFIHSYLVFVDYFCYCLYLPDISVTIFAEICFHTTNSHTQARISSI